VGGGGEGAGKIVNVGWNEKGLGDGEYFAAWDCVVLPVLKEFAPEVS